MSLQKFRHSTPVDLESALQAIAHGAVPYCGGTELLAAMNMGMLRPEEIVSLRRVTELGGITVQNGHLRLGAITRHRELIHDHRVVAHAPLLVDVARRIGNARVRAQGTVGGNLAFAEPRSDLSTALIALGATVCLSTNSSRRRESLVEFLQGPYETTLQEGELLTGIEVDRDVADIALYRKVTFTERPAVGVAVVHLNQADMWRVVVGAVGEQPLIREVKTLDDVDPAEIAGSVDVLSDHNGSDDYKRHVTHVTITRCCSLAAEQAAVEESRS